MPKLGYGFSHQGSVECVNLRYKHQSVKTLLFHILTSGDGGSLRSCYFIEKYQEYFCMQLYNPRWFHTFLLLVVIIYDVVQSRKKV